MSQVLGIYYYPVSVLGKLIFVWRYTASELRVWILESDRLGFKSWLYQLPAEYP